MVGASKLAAEILRRLRHPVRAAGTAWMVAARFRSGGLPAVRALFGDGMRQPQRIDPQAYAQWIALHDDPGPHDWARMRAEVAALEHRPSISIVMPVYDTPAPVLEQTIESVLAQIYPDWQLCIADDASPSAHVGEILARYAARDERVRVTRRVANGGIAEATNTAFALASGEWIALLDHDDLLRPHSLLEIAKAIGAGSNVELVYSDEDKIDAEGKRFDPFFKPDFSPSLLRSMNYLNHLSVHRAANVRAVGGWRAEFDGSQDFDLNLRIVERVRPEAIVHVPKVLYHWRALEGSVAQEAGEKSYAFSAGRCALTQHWDRIGRPAIVSAVPGTPYYGTEPPGDDFLEPVTLVIATRDNEALLRNCIASITAHTRYPRFDIVVVDNQTRDPGAKAYLAELEKNGTARIASYDRAFNFSAINNLGVRHAKGSLVCLLNNDIEVISPSWLAEMAWLALDPAIGCVGAKLRYADGSIQHAGVVLGIGGVAGHAHKHAGGKEPGYFGRLHVTHEVSAVTGACLLVRRSVYEEVGGLNEEDLAVAFNDVDFCLRVREAGYRNVVVPSAQLFHLESASRGPEDDPAKRARFERESDYMRRRWGALLNADPYYSPNLTLEREDLSLAHPPKTN